MNVIHKMILAYMRDNEFYTETTDYDQILKHYISLNWDIDIIENHLADLFDSGYIYEPVLGKVKVT